MQPLKTPAPRRGCLHYWVRRNDISLSPYSEPLSASRPPTAPRAKRAEALSDRVHLEGTGRRNRLRSLARAADRASAVRLTSPSATAFDDMTAPRRCLCVLVRARSRPGRARSARLPRPPPAGRACRHCGKPRNIAEHYGFVAASNQHHGYEIWNRLFRSKLRQNNDVAAGQTMILPRQQQPISGIGCGPQTRLARPVRFNSGFRALCAPDISPRTALARESGWPGPGARGKRYELWRAPLKKPPLPGACHGCIHQLF